MDVELEPEQPEPVERAIAEVLGGGDGDGKPDPWWQAGVDEALGNGSDA